MVAIPFPYGAASAEKTVGRMEMRSPPPKAAYDEGDERSFRDEVERALRAGDDAYAQIERRLRALEAAILP